MGVDNGDPEDSLPLVARELFRRLRRRADRTVAQALVIAIDLQCGYAPAEIRERHAMTEDDYRRAREWARLELDAMRATPRATAAGT